MTCCGGTGNGCCVALMCCRIASWLSAILIRAATRLAAFDSSCVTGVAGRRLVPGCNCDSGGGGTGGCAAGGFPGVEPDMSLESAMKSRGMSGDEGASDKGERSTIGGSGNEVWLRSRRSEARSLGRLVLLLAELEGI